MKKILLGLGLFLLVVICGGIAVSMLNDETKTHTNGENILTEPQVSISTTANPRVSQRPDTIREGTWEVGTDVQPGRYKTKGALTGIISTCYWHTAPDDSDQNIIDQGVVSGADEQGLVTLKKGQFFKTSGCQDWIRIVKK